MTRNAYKTDKITNAYFRLKTMNQLWYQYAKLFIFFLSERSRSLGLVLNKVDRWTNPGL